MACGTRRRRLFESLSRGDGQLLARWRPVAVAPDISTGAYRGCVRDACSTEISAMRFGAWRPASRSAAGEICARPRLSPRHFPASREPIGRMPCRSSSWRHRFLRLVIHHLHRLMKYEMTISNIDSSRPIPIEPSSIAMVDRDCGVSRWLRSLLPARARWRVMARCCAAGA